MAVLGQHCGKIGGTKQQHTTYVEVNNMRTQSLKTQLITISAIIFALALFRLLPHWPNVSPVAAMALFGGAYFADKKMAFIVPFVALFLSDLILGLHNTMVFVYAGFALTVAIGFLLKNRVNVTNTAFAAIASSVLFFLFDQSGRLDDIWIVCEVSGRTNASLCGRHSIFPEFFTGKSFL